MIFNSESLFLLTVTAYMIRLSNLVMFAYDLQPKYDKLLMGVLILWQALVLGICTAVKEEREAEGPSLSYKVFFIQLISLLSLLLMKTIAVGLLLVLRLRSHFPAFYMMIKKALFAFICSFFTCIFLTDVFCLLDYLIESSSGPFSRHEKSVFVKTKYVSEWLV